MSRLLVLLADESHDFLEGLQAWFAIDPSIEVVSVLHPGPGIFSEVERLRPDLVVLDVRVHPAVGFEAARRIRATVPEAIILLTSFHSSAAARALAQSVGADRFLAKSEAIGALADIVLKLKSRLTSRSS